MPDPKFEEEGIDCRGFVLLATAGVSNIFIRFPFIN